MKKLWIRFLIVSTVQIGGDSVSLDCNTCNTLYCFLLTLKFFSDCNPLIKPSCRNRRSGGSCCSLNFLCGFCLRFIYEYFVSNRRPVISYLSIFFHFYFLPRRCGFSLGRTTWSACGSAAIPKSRDNNPLRMQRSADKLCPCTKRYIWSYMIIRLVSVWLVAVWL